MTYDALLQAVARQEGTSLHGTKTCAKLSSQHQCTSNSKQANINAFTDTLHRKKSTIVGLFRSTSVIRSKSTWGGLCYGTRWGLYC